MADALTVDVYSDLVCPWCFLGKRRLAAARRSLPRLAVDVRWRPFELNPDLAAGGMDRRAYLAQKFGDSAQLAANHDRLVELGRADGIAYRFEAIERVPNTRSAHVLVSQAGPRQDELVERLFAGYFERGLDLGRAEVLEAIAAEAGLDPALIRTQLGDAALRDAVAAEERTAARLGIGGVPFFVLAGRWAISGAQEASVLASALERVAAEAARGGSRPLGAE
ncbi:MAG: DsbA family oxidoreductase [Proteobacteria bacterium]|nr:DsbA family oxidoreductase [Pseudomonadota bacterium]